jgi:drug/metabolite transporter (DMT)-like permease
MRTAAAKLFPNTGFNTLPLAIGAFCALWSFAFVAGKTGVSYCRPELLLAVRFTLAGVLILGTAAARGALRLTWRDAGAFALIGLMNNALYLGISYAGLRTISAGLSGLIISTNPIFTALLAAALLGEQLTWRKAAGLALGLAGVALIVSHRVVAGMDQPTGILLTFLALAALVAGTILFKKLAPRGELWVGNGIQNLAAGLALTPFAVMGPHRGIVFAWPLFGAFLFLVLGGSIIAFQIWFHLLKTCGATKASAFHFLIPPLAMIFAWIVLGERIVLSDLLGIVPVAAGIFLVTHAGRQI